MDDFFPSAPWLLVAIAVGYMLGALPLAQHVSRRNGIDIFSTGTGLAGASNVLHNVGKWQAGFVLFGDIVKGALAVLISQILGVDGPWVLLPAAAAIAGHWSSVFSGFRGGDGLATLGGIVIALFSGYGIMCVAIGGMVALGGRKMPYTSLFSIVFAYGALATFSLRYYGDLGVTFGVGGLAAVVLAYALFGHHRRRRNEDWDDIADHVIATEHTRLRS